MKPPVFTTQEKADEWLERAELFQEQAMYAARQVWLAEDGTIIGYNTASVPRGGFCSFRYRPDEYGMPAELIFVRHHSQRKAARSRALALYRKYSPKWAGKSKGRDF